MCGFPLKRFEYSTAEQGATADDRVILDVDFEKRNLAFKGEGFNVKTTIYPGSGLELLDKSSDGLVFSLEGILEDGKTINTCSGLLVLYCATESTDWSDRNLRMAVYLYDDFNSDREIKLNLSMLLLAKSAELN